MFWRPKPETKPQPEPTKAVPVVTADPSQLLGELLSRPTEQGVMENALERAVKLVAPGDVRGLAVLRREDTKEDRVVALKGYGPMLMDTVLAGPWSSGRARVVTDGASEMIAMNTPEARTILDSVGMRDASALLVAPMVERGRQYGALLLVRHDRTPFAPSDLDVVNRWAAAVTPLLQVFTAAEEERQLARQLARAMADAAEAQDFDATGHARAVTSVAGRLAQVLSLNERDREQLWFAAMLHDVGKLSGEEGHPMMGANYLHDVSALSTAAEAVRHHHERWDGTGEPGGLSKEQIPLLSRIIAVANGYVYSGSAAALEAESGQRYDPRIVAAAVRMEEQEDGNR